MRGFVFSLDAFVAFSLALIAVYSLIFFSSVPSSYFYLLTQGHYLARDSLLATATTRCEAPFVCGPVTGTLLDAIVSPKTSEGIKKALIKETIGSIIPKQFGYKLEVSWDNGVSWELLYDTSEEVGDEHAKKMRKLSVSSQMVNFGYTYTYQKETSSPFTYITCRGEGVHGDIVITCGNSSLRDPNAVAETVPLPEVRIVKLTVFI